MNVFVPCEYFSRMPRKSPRRNGKMKMGFFFLYFSFLGVSLMWDLDFISLLLANRNLEFMFLAQNLVGITKIVKHLLIQLRME